MADLLGPSFLRPTDSWSFTEVKSMKHTHVWTVKGFSQCDCRYIETPVKPVPNDAQLVYRIRLHPQGNKESNKDFTFFQVFSNNTLPRYRGKFTVFNSRNEEIATTVYTGQQQLHGYFEYIRRDLLINHLAPSDELQLLLELTLIFDTVTKSCLTRPSQIEPRQQDVNFRRKYYKHYRGFLLILTESLDKLYTVEMLLTFDQNVHTFVNITADKSGQRWYHVARDLEELYREKKLTDFTIHVGGRQIAVHKAVLIARSPVFGAMLEPHTEESQNNCVHVDDIDADVLNEMLFYIYSGRSPNLKEMAAELLGAADRFALTSLKDMAEQVLRTNLSIETVCRVLVLAEMHGARELKQDAINFVAQNSTQVIQTDGWRQLISSSPTLVTEVVSAISNEQACTNGEPAQKRLRSSASQDVVRK